MPLDIAMETGSHRLYVWVCRLGGGWGGGGAHLGRDAACVLTDWALCAAVSSREQAEVDSAALRFLSSADLNSSALYF